MRSLLKILFLLSVLAAGNPAAFAASFTASLDRDTIALGETATLSLTFEGGSPKNVPTPHVAGLQFAQTGNSQSFSIVNGAMSSTVTVTFTVAAQRTGAFTIPALTADVGGEQLSTAPLALNVVKADAPSTAALESGNEIAFLKLSLPQKKVYTGQLVVAEMQLYLRDDVQNFGNFQLSPIATDGFSAGKIVESQQRRAQIGNRIYRIIPILLPLTTVKSGPLTLGPVTASAVVVLPGQNQGGDPFIRQFFNQGEQKPVTLTTEQISVESLPLPSENVPANFNGAIGNFTLAVSAGPTNLTAGDPITVRVQISGRGAFDTLALPAQNDWQEFKTFPPTAKFEANDQFGFQGIKTFEQIVSPQNSDVHELPPFSFSFFNPDDGQYHTLTKPALALAVHSAGTVSQPAIAGNKNSSGETPSAPDIFPIRQNLGVGRDAVGPLISQPAFLAVQSLPVLAFLAAFIWRKRTDKLANNPRLRRKLAVEKLVENGIASLRKLAAENNSEEFFALLFRLLQEQLGERLDCPASAITENVVEENSLLRTAPAATRNDLCELFQLCNQARYAPVRGTAELNSVAAQLEKTVFRLREVKV